MTRPSGSVIPRGVPFAQIPHDITLDMEVTCVAYRVYGLLMKLANTESRAWPGHRYLEDHLPISRPTIANGIANLEDTGWLLVDRSAQAHQYTVLAERGWLDLDWSGNLTGEEPSPVKKDDRTGKESSPEPVKNLDPIENQDREPEQRTSLATPNVAWDFLTHTHTFNLPAKTTAQKKRVGRLARELNASIDAFWLDEPSFHDATIDMQRRAMSWPDHFPDATMTAEAFVKHFELLGAPPLKQSKGDSTRARTRAAMDALADGDRR